MKKKIMIAVGGTGGHVYPALALANQLKEKGMEVCFIGGGLIKNKYFTDHEYPFYDVACGTFSLRKPWKFFSGSFSILKGMLQSLKNIKRWKPDLIVGFGSFYTVPPLLAAKWNKIPIVLHTADSIPGRVIKVFSPYAAAIGTNFPIESLKGNVQVVGIPLRKGFQKGLLSLSEAREYFRLDPNVPTILVFGGSHGAQAINELFAEAAKNHLDLMRPFQVIHVTGDPKQTPALIKEYAEAGIRACVKDFESQMNYAWAAADCVVARAGAATIAEQVEYEVPGVLIPYPFAMDNHQDHNADIVEKKIGLGKKCVQKNLKAQTLAEEIKASFEEREARQEKAKKYKSFHGKSDLCSLVISQMN